MLIILKKDIITLFKGEKDNAYNAKINTILFIVVY
jgi:hypothetical protein